MVQKLEISLENRDINFVFIFNDHMIKVHVFIKYL